MSNVRRIGPHFQQRKAPVFDLAILESLDEWRSAIAAKLDAEDAKKVARSSERVASNQVVTAAKRVVAAGEAMRALLKASVEASR